MLDQLSKEIVINIKDLNGRFQAQMTAAAAEYLFGVKGLQSNGNFGYVRCAPGKETFRLIQSHSANYTEDNASTTTTFIQRKRKTDLRERRKL